MGSPVLIEDLCRLCAQVDHGINLFSNAGQSQNLFIKMKVCVPIQIVENDELTTHICCKCISKLNVAYELYTSSIAVQPKIREIHAKRKNIAEVTESSPNSGNVSNNNTNGNISNNNTKKYASNSNSSLSSSNGSHSKLESKQSSSSDIVIQSVLSLSQSDGKPAVNGFEPTTPPLSGSEKSSEEDQPARKKERKTVCQYCCKWYPRSVIREHEEIHLKSGVFYSCTVCQQVFPTTESFNSHVCKSKK